ncbi:MAG: zinc-dependent alcohol dehydrogenase family protein [Anaerolineales bacterium]|nr:zinc-dependent alcohol dehydrogenase family protein [Anaerolineales bacterium]
MKAMVLNQVSLFTQNKNPLKLTELPNPEPGPGDILIKVCACGVCHTELDEIEGRTPPPEFPMILGHQVVGIVEQNGAGADRFQPGERVGVAWIYSACGECKYCLSGQENLCPDFRATGRDAHGGYAEYMTVPQGFAYPIPKAFSDSEVAPLLCAGAIGYRSLRLAEMQAGQRLGLTGFGASGHLVLKLARFQYPNSEVYVFSRNPAEREFAIQLGAAWAGEIDATPAEKLDVIIDTTPAWKPVVEALRNLAPGGRLVINAIRKEDIDKDYLLKLDYPAHLWMEKEIKSVANVARRDVSEFLELAEKIPIKPEYQEFPLEDANQALLEVRTGKIRGGKVLRIA